MPASAGKADRPIRAAFDGVMRIARESLPIAALLAAAGVALWLWVHPWAAVVPLLLLLFTLWFFRDPERRTPQDPDALISPADGKIIKAETREISIFMNVFSVHVCRAPMAGTVETVQHVPGRFLAAFKDHASEQNERTSIVLTDGRRRLGVTLVAGLIARRIVCKVSPGQLLQSGERLGLIQFGSRVDVALPEGGSVEVELGQHAVAGETILATLEPEPAATDPEKVP